MLRVGTEGGIPGYIKKDVGFRHGVYFYKGTLTNQSLGEAFNLPYKNIDLLLAAL